MITPIRCTDLNCLRGNYKKEYSENDISNDISFLNKLFEFNADLDERELLKEFSSDLQNINEVNYILKIRI